MFWIVKAVARHGEQITVELEGRGYAWSKPSTRLLKLAASRYANATYLIERIRRVRVLQRHESLKMRRLKVLRDEIRASGRKELYDLNHPGVSLSTCYRPDLGESLSIRYSSRHPMLADGDLANTTVPERIAWLEEQKSYQPMVREYARLIDEIEERKLVLTVLLDLLLRLWLHLGGDNLALEVPTADGIALVLGRESVSDHATSYADKRILKVSIYPDDYTCKKWG